MDSPDHSASQTTNHLFAVGAGHLAGSNGVIHLLRKEGYKVKPVKF
ncbi:MAG: TraB/GumN family protein [Saprospiraceae bacterium]|nr:TraB/GumN family protein [Saprospiraceae bacterium]